MKDSIYGFWQNDKGVWETMRLCIHHGLTLFKMTIGKKYDNWNCRECARESAAIYNRSHKDKKDIYQKDPINKEKVKERYKTIRNGCITLLGGKCVSCGQEDINLLVFDHINGCGTKNRLNRIDLYKDIKENTSKYQLLCWNCNRIKTYENDETTRKVAVKNLTQKERRIYDRRHEIRYNLLIDMGGACSNCGETNFKALEIDHIEGGGRRAKAMGEEPQSFIARTKYIRNNRDKFQLLCANCNALKVIDRSERSNAVYIKKETKPRRKVEIGHAYGPVTVLALDHKANGYIYWLVNRRGKQVIVRGDLILRYLNNEER